MLGNKWLMSIKKLVIEKGNEKEKKTYQMLKKHCMMSLGCFTAGLSLL